MLRQRFTSMIMVKKIFVGLTAVIAVVLTGLIAGSYHMKLDILHTLRGTHRYNSAVHAVGDQNQTWDVILSTYMRSGSTFLGKMLGHRNDSFYMCEPLWRNFSWKYYREDGKVCDYIKPTCGNDSAFARKALDTALHFLSDFYSCRLTPHANMIEEPLQHPEGSGPSWQAYRVCRKSKMSSPSKCLPKLEPICRKATHRVTKVLRMDFSYIDKLLQDNHRLKAILLLRDPRGVLSSHINAKNFRLNRADAKSLAEDAEVLCSRMERDIKVAKSLLVLYPTRVKIIQYEDFDDPVRKLKKLYSFINMDAGRLPLKLVSKNHKVAQSSNDRSRDMFSYRTKLDWRTVQMLDSHCRNVIRELGLVQYKDEKHLRNVSQSPIINALPYSLEAHYRPQFGFLFR